MYIQIRFILLTVIIAAVLMPVNSNAGWGDGDRNVDSCTSNSDFRDVVPSLGSNIDICIATSNWLEAVERNGVQSYAQRLENRLETAMSNFCGGSGKVLSGQTSTGGGSKVRGDYHYMWVTAEVKCTWM